MPRWLPLPAAQRRSVALTELLDQRVAAIRAGELTVEQVLERDGQPELTELLLIALEIHAEVDADAEWEAGALGRFVVALEREPLPARTGQSWGAGRWFTRLRSAAARTRQTWQRVIAVLAAATLATGAGAVYASEQALPGDTLYGVKLAVEHMRLATAPDEEVRIELELDIALRRLAEVERALEVNNEPAAAVAASAFAQRMSVVEARVAAGRLSLQLELDEKMEIARERGEELSRGVLARSEPSLDRDRDAIAPTTPPVGLAGPPTPSALPSSGSTGVASGAALVTAPTPQPPAPGPSSPTSHSAPPSAPAANAPALVVTAPPAAPTLAPAASVQPDPPSTVLPMPTVGIPLPPAGVALPPSARSETPSTGVQAAAPVPGDLQLLDSPTPAIELPPSIEPSLASDLKPDRDVTQPPAISVPAVTPPVEEGSSAGPGTLGLVGATPKESPPHPSAPTPPAANELPAVEMPRSVPIRPLEPVRRAPSPEPVVPTPPALEPAPLASPTVVGSSVPTSPTTGGTLPDPIPPGVATQSPAERTPVAGAATPAAAPTSPQLPPPTVPAPTPAPVVVTVIQPPSGDQFVSPAIQPGLALPKP